MIESLTGVLNTGFVSSWVKSVCDEDWEVIERPAAFFVRNRQEDAHKVQRVIVLPPKGYTANSFNQTNSHDEALQATIQIKGAVRSGKKGFSKLKNCLLLAAFNTKSGVSDLNVPYLTFDLKDTPNLSASFHSAGTPPFSVVKPDGFGFYHNLINVSDDWLVLKLNKRLRPQKGVELTGVLKGIPSTAVESLTQLYEGIVTYGDEVFMKLPDVVDEVIKLAPEISLPALGEMLYAYDTGRHEACSSFAMILKVGKLHYKTTLDYLNGAADTGIIPSYYAQQLMDKLNRWHNLHKNPYNLNFE